MVMINVVTCSCQFGILSPVNSLQIALIMTGSCAPVKQQNTREAREKLCDYSRSSAKTCNQQARGYGLMLAKCTPAHIMLAEVFKHARLRGQEDYNMLVLIAIARGGTDLWPSSGLLAHRRARLLGVLRGAAG
jgi:hypothetical protein